MIIRRNFLKSLEIESVDSMSQLEQAFSARDARLFEDILRNVDWSNRPASEYLRATRLALEVGAYTSARRIAVLGGELYPDNPEIQKQALALGPPAIVRKKVSFDPSIRANRDWLAAHGDEYRGKWVALRSGELLGSAASIDDLISVLGTHDHKDILLTTVY